MKTEVQYADVPGFPGYRVGDDGSVWSRWEKISDGRGFAHRLGSNWKQLRPNQVGVPSVVLCKNGKHTTITVCRLVLSAFVGPCPEGMEACHFPDRDPANNRLDNLRWDTRRGNCQDAKTHGTSSEAERHGGSKITVEDVLEIRERFSQGEPQRSIAKSKGIHQSNVSLIVRNLAWKSVKE